MTGVFPPAPLEELDVVAAAYLGVRPGLRPEGMDDRYIREPFMDLSSCLVPVGPRATWAGSDIDKDLLALGVPAGAVNAAKAWIDDVDHRGGLLYPNVFRRPQDVAEFSELYVPDGLAVLGVALAADQVDRFLDEQPLRGPA